MSEDKATFDTGDEKAAKDAAEQIMASSGALPESGAARQKELSLKAERLIQKAEELLAQIDIAPAKDGALEIDREIRAALSEMNEVYVSNAQTDTFAYSWIYRDPHNDFGGRYVRKMQALGWERVSGDMPEASEHRFVDGSRVVADCLLMRIQLDRKMLLEKRDRMLREAQQAGIQARVYDLAERAGTRALDTAELMNLQGETITDHAMANRRASARGHFHRMNAGGKMDRMLKEGRIPGVPSPGRSR